MEEIKKKILSDIQVFDHSENMGPAAARNSGIKIAKENEVKYVLFTDSDCEVDKSWVKDMLTCQKAEAGVYVGLTKSSQDDVYSRYHNTLGTLNGRLLKNDRLLYGPTCNMSVAVEKLPENPFDEKFPTSAFEDVDFCLNLFKSHKIKTKLCAAIVTHNYDNSFWGFYNQFYKYGTSHPLLFEKHEDYGAMYVQSKEISIKKERK